MKENKDKELDNLFKNGLEDPVYQSGYLEDDWDALEKMLDREKKRPGLIFWLPVLSSAAAILIFFGWWFFTPAVVTHNQTKQQQMVAITKATKNEGANSADKIAENKKTAHANVAAVKKENSSVSLPNSISLHNNIVPNGNTNTKKELAVNSKLVSPGTINGLNQTNNKNKPVNVQDVQKTNNNTETLANNIRPEAATLVVINYDVLANGVPGSNQYMVSTPVESKDIVSNSYKPAPVKTESSVTKLGFVKRPQLALTFLGAPELNSAGSLGDGKSGTNVGLLFSAGIFNKLTVSTGANYSVKPYNTDIADYHTTYKFKTDPSDIEADCRVLDIPINLDYQLYNKHKNKFSIGTGLSSYIMLHESYNYYYADPNTKGPVAYTVPNSGKYFFGIMNLQATYQRQINSKVGLSIEPYMKLPLANIGYSQVKLQTAGVAVGLSWNLNSLTKP